MTNRQLNASYYSRRDRKLKALEKIGLLDDFKEFNKGKKYLCIESYLNNKIVDTLFNFNDGTLMIELQKISKI